MARRIYVLFACIILVLYCALPVSAGGKYEVYISDKLAIDTTSGTRNLDSITVFKSGDAKVDSDDYDFKGLNAAIRASGGAILNITGSSIISTDATYSSAVFSYGGYLDGKSTDKTTINIDNAQITTLRRNSGGIMVTGGGIINATSLDIITLGDSSAALRSDKGGGKITVTEGRYMTKGRGSPAIYSTADITVTSADLSADQSQGVVIEGGNSVTLKNSNVTANHATRNGNDSTLQAILIYQSMSGDSSDGEGTFTMTGGSIKNINGDIFLVTNTYCTINLTSVDITSEDPAGYFLRAEGQEWGTAGSNGGRVILNASYQPINGNIIISGDSRLNMTLSDGSTFTGAIESNDKVGAVKVTIGASSKWIMTADSYISALSKDVNGDIISNNYKLYISGDLYDGISTSVGSYDEREDYPPVNDDDGDDDTPGVGPDPKPQPEQKGPKITTESLSNATVGKAYSKTLQATSKTTITWSAEGLPSGLTLAKTGKISGKPKVSGSYDVTFTASDSEGSNSKIILLKVLDVKPTIKASIKAGKIDYPYEVKFTDSAGTGIVSWDLEGELPNGLSFDKQTHILYGTPTEAFSDYITVTATNTGGTASKKAKLTIKAVKPVITFPNIKDALKDSPYSISVDVNGSMPIDVTVTNIPDGMDYEYFSQDKVLRIAGTPTTEGKFNMKILATNEGGKANKSKKLVVQSKPSITTEDIGEATAGKSYNVTFKADGSKKIAWSVAGGTIPKGMSLAASNGKLKGKATTYDTYNFTIRAKNTYGTDSRDYSLKVNAVAPQIKTSSLKKGKAGSAYKSIIKVKGTEPLTWSLEGNLPDNVSFDKGTFTGTPKRSFNDSVTISVSNGGGSANNVYSLLIKAIAPKITTKTLSGGTVGKAYSATLKATGTPDIKWDWSGEPPGLVLDADTGEISGTPTTAGTYKTTFTATNDAKTVKKSTKLIIAEGASADKVEKVKDAPESELELDDKVQDSLPEALEQELAAEDEPSGDLPYGVIVAAELPEVSVDVSGMYDLEAVLSDLAPVGAKLYWSSGASAPSDDDDIAEFADTDGQEIDTVQEKREVIVSVWLNKGITYKPVIYVKP